MTWKTMEYAGWGRALKAEGRIARPERASALKRLCADSPAPAIGNRRSYGDAPLNSDGDAIDMTRMDRIIDFDADAGLLQVEAGCTISNLAQLFAPLGWLPPVMPGTGFATVGGCIAMDVHGKNHHHAGSFGQHVTALTLLQGETRKTVTPERQGTLFKATVGGLGQTGVIEKATIQMLPCKGDVMVVTERRVENLDEHLAVLDASDATYSVGWVDATAMGDALGRGIVEEGETGGGLVPKRKGAKSVPFDAPAFALSPRVVRNFNAAYFRRVPPSGRTVVKPITDFFFPLDRIHDWNRLYGKTGFHQFQCVLPLSETAVLREMLEVIGRAGIASPLAVLKRMGPGRAGFMSFPMEGYTLAVDFPNRGHAIDLVIRLQDMTADAGGRIYLAKDALARGGDVRAMYPEWHDWRVVAEKSDPEGNLTTDLVRRLDLRSAP
ncbi:MAG: FAD-binding oxidoreductase [Pseudomonadota bacterium]